MKSELPSKHLPSYLGCLLVFLIFIATLIFLGVIPAIGFCIGHVVVSIYNRRKKANSDPYSHHRTTPIPLTVGDAIKLFCDLFYWFMLIMLVGYLLAK
jgi:heme/copper-type cytochrome/quinol oxidase subunit 2